MKLNKSNAAAVIEELEAMAQKLSISIRYESFRKGDFAVRSGACVMRGERLIIVDRGLSPVDRGDVLITEFSKLTVEDFFISPGVRELLESNRPLQPA